MDKKKDNQKKEETPKNPLLKPDKETQNTTDPQEHMKGPISSIMQNIKEEAEENDEEGKEKSDKKKDENT
jgi:hypothetical protein